MMPPKSLERRVLEAARRQPPARPAAGARAAAAGLAPGLLALTAMTAVLAAWSAWSGGLATAAGRPAAVGAWIVSGTAALAVAATALALPSRRSMLSPARGRLLAVAVGVPLLLGAWLALWHPTYPDPYLRVGVRCLLLTALSAPWPFLALLRASRRADPTNGPFTGAALGAAAGAWGAVMVELWCPLADGGHVLLGHVAPLALLAVGGAAFGARRFGLRRVE